MPRLSLLLFVAACSSNAALPDAAPPVAVATGAVGAWRTAAPLPIARANLCAASIDNWVLAIGGNHADATGNFVKTAEIDAAQLADDGTLGPWQVAGMLPSPASECVATSDGNHLYVIDGLYDDEADAGQVFTADLDATGHLGTLTSAGTLPSGDVVISQSAFVRDGTLAVMNPALPDPGSATDPANTVQTIRTAMSGPLAWNVDGWNITWRDQAQYAFGDSFAYVIGGYGEDDVNTVTTDVYMAPIGANAAIGASAKTAPLPVATAFGKGVAVDDWVFVVGGRGAVFGGTATTAVWAAHVGSDGTLGAWQPQTALSQPRTNQAMVLVGSYLVSVGGANAAGGDTTVLYSQVRSEPAEPK